jgi:serine protease Do
MSNQTNILLRHIDGSKAGQTEKFTVSNDLEIKIGRGQANNIAYDLADDSISREHCRIKVNSLLPDTYEITDLQSKNGTFVNGKAITEKTVLFAGDIIRLGKEGPTLEFDLDPKPVSHIKKTRVIDAPEIPSKETKVHATGMTNVTGAKPTPVKETIGKQTMQHIIQESEKKGKKRMAVISIALLLILGTGAWLVYANKPVKEIIHEKGKDSVVIIGDTSKKISPVQITKDNSKNVVFIEIGWNLKMTNGEQLYHVKVPVKEFGVINYYAAYTTNSLGAIEPLLCAKGEEPAGAILDPIGGFGSGTGFVVDPRGFIVTNRHVAAPWETTYSFKSDDFPGRLYTLNSKGGFTYIPNKVVTPQDVETWIPANAMNLNLLNVESGVTVIKGESTYMDVTFANNSIRIPAGKVTPSPSHDVAIFKIEIVEELSAVKLLNNYNEIETGSEVTVMGYPGMSPDQYVATASNDFFNRNAKVVKVPVPTVSAGIVGRLVKANAGTEKVAGYFNAMGDYYQLTINSTGPGNSGGPMFDNQGNVIGIYSAGNAKMSFAIPIKYALELMGREDVIN